MNVSIIVGDCREILPTLADQSVQCCVTSPPYWGLRDYGHGEQIGLESTPDAFVAEMVLVFRQVRRILKDDGTLWLNLGDSYAANRGGTNMPAETLAGGVNGKSDYADPKRGRVRHGQRQAHRDAPSIGLKHKDLIGMPWRVAFALQADGWYLRSDIIWHKPNPMPESVSDRPTKSHEYLFLLTKSANYYYDAEAIKEPVSGTANARGNGVNPKAKANGPNSRMVRERTPDGITNKPNPSRSNIRPKQNESFSGAVNGLVDFRNKRSVWTVGTYAYPEAHFATYPPDLIKPCILAGSRPGDTVLDPFGGSGTTGMVALELGRSAILCELNPEYAELARTRCSVTPGFPNLV